LKEVAQRTLNLPLQRRRRDGAPPGFELPAEAAGKCLALSISTVIARCRGSWIYWRWDSPLHATAMLLLAAPVTKVPYIVLSPTRLGEGMFRFLPSSRSRQPAEGRGICHRSRAKRGEAVEGHQVMVPPRRPAGRLLFARRRHDRQRVARLIHPRTMRTRLQPDSSTALVLDG